MHVSQQLVDSQPVCLSGSRKLPTLTSWGQPFSGVALPFGWQAGGVPHCSSLVGGLEAQEATKPHVSQALCAVQSPQRSPTCCLTEGTEAQRGYMTCPEPHGPALASSACLLPLSS